MCLRRTFDFSVHFLTFAWLSIVLSQLFDSASQNLVYIRWNNSSLSPSIYENRKSCLFGELRQRLLSCGWFFTNWISMKYKAFSVLPSWMRITIMILEMFLPFPVRLAGLISYQSSFNLPFFGCGTWYLYCLSYSIPILIGASLPTLCWHLVGAVQSLWSYCWCSNSFE